MSYVIMFVCGITAALPFVFSELWPLGWLSVAPLFWAASEKKSAYRHGLCYFAGFYGLIYHWFVYLYPMDFAGFDHFQSAIVIALCWLGMTILQGPVFALVAPLYKLLRTGRDYIDPFIAASLWVIFEWLQTQTWLGVPWARLAVTQYRFLPAIQSASLLGSLFVSFLMALTGGFIAVALKNLGDRKTLHGTGFVSVEGGESETICAAGDASAEPYKSGKAEKSNVSASGKSGAWKLLRVTAAGKSVGWKSSHLSAPGNGTGEPTKVSASDARGKGEPARAFTYDISDVGVPSHGFSGDGSADKTLRASYKHGAAVCFIIAAAICAANIAYGIATLALYDDDDAVGVTAAVIQGNIASGDKWKDGSVYKTLEIYSELTLEACIKYSPQIVLWPETAMNVPLRNMPDMCEQISELAESTGAVIFVGAFDYIDDIKTGETLSYNAIVAFYPDGTIGEEPYYKRHLVPFGEYLPMPWFFKTFLPMLAEMNLFQSDLTPGEGTNLIDTVYGKLGGLVCFDSIYGELVRESTADGANLIILSTNDSWYRDSAAVYQHNGHAVLRAVENGRYLVRSANTGVSSIISPTGRMLTMLGPLIKGVAAADVKMLTGRTLYSYVGDAWISACALLVAGLGIYKAATAAGGKKEKAK